MAKVMLRENGGEIYFYIAKKIWKRPSKPWSLIAMRSGVER